MILTGHGIQPQHGSAPPETATLSWSGDLVTDLKPVLTCIGSRQYLFQGSMILLYCTYDYTWYVWKFLNLIFSFSLVYLRVFFLLYPACSTFPLEYCTVKSKRERGFSTELCGTANIATKREADGSASQDTEPCAHCTGACRVRSGAHIVLKVAHTLSTEHFSAKTCHPSSGL